MSSRFPTTVNFSLHRFARHGGLTAPHKDGWGIVYYEGGDIRRVREAAPAASSDIVRFIERHEFTSTLVVSHIRQATQGGLSLRNTQPFARELGGRVHVFAHNGDLREVQEHPELKPIHYRPIGETDSEYAFCALLTEMQRVWLTANGVPPLNQRLRIVSRFASTVRALGTANFIYADGETVFLHGHIRRDPVTGIEGPPGLHTLLRGRAGVPAAMDLSGLHLTAHDEGQSVMLAASIPLTGEAWEPQPPGRILAVSQGQVVATVEC